MDDEDALRRLERRLDEASERAQRLVVDAAQASLRGSPRPPEAGWEAPGSGTRDDQLEPLLQTVKALGELIPPELERRLTEAVRELLLALRALLDWYIERLEGRRETPREVQDIPIL